MSEVEFSITGFGFAQHSLTTTQKRTIRMIADRLFSGDDEVPRLSATKIIEIIGYAIGTHNLEMHANKRAESVLNELKGSLRQLGTSNTEIAKIKRGEPVTKHSSGPVRVGDRQVLIVVHRRALPASGPYHPLIGSGKNVQAAYLRSDDTDDLLEELLSTLIGECKAGAHGRRRVPDSTQIPFRWICSIESIFVDPDDRRKLVTFGLAATGVLISPRHVLTAGHVLRNSITGSNDTEKVSDAIAVRVIPGINGPPVTFPLGIVAAQFRHFGGSRLEKRFRGMFRISEAWRHNEDARFDFGLIKLPLLDGEPLGELRVRGEKMGWWGSPDFRDEAVIEPIGKSKLDGHPITLVGYPLDKQLKDNEVRAYEQWLSSGEGRVRGYSQWVEDNFITSGPTRETVLQFKSGRVITYDACTLSGNSGSPVWIIDAKKRRNLVAVHSRGIQPADLAPYEFGAGVRLSTSVGDELREWQKTM